MEFVGLFAWLGAAIGAGAIASSKNRSFFGYFLLGFLLPLVGLLIAIGMAPRQPAAAGAARGGGFAVVFPGIVLVVAVVVVYLATR